MGEDERVSSHHHEHRPTPHDHPEDHDRFSDLAATWDERPGALERARDVAAAIRATLPLSRETSVLEIGGGTGLLSRALVDDIGTAVVTDVSPGMVDVATGLLDEERYAGWRAELFDIEHDPLPEERFDLVVSLLALHHMGDLATVLGRVLELVVPGGQVALADLEHDADGGFHRHVEDFDGHHGYTRQALTSALGGAGFCDVSVEVVAHLTKDVDGESRTFPILLAVGRRP